MLSTVRFTLVHAVAGLLNSVYPRSQVCSIIRSEVAGQCNQRKDRLLAANRDAKAASLLS